MPFVVQPIRNAFAAVGDRPLEVASTLRASPTRAFWTVALPLASPGLLTGAVLGFAHTVGEFGVILMIGGNIPGRTRVMSTAIFDFVETMRWREANLLAGGMVAFAFVVILAMTLLEKRFARSGRVTAHHAIRAQFRGAIGKFALDAGFTAPAKGVTALFGPSGCGKTTVLRCIAGLLRINGVCEIDGEVWQDENGAFLPTHKRPLGYVFQEASLFQHLSVRRNLLFGAPRKDGWKAKDAIAFDEVVELLGVERLLDRSAHAISRAASASGSRSGARFCRSRSFC